MSEKQPRLCAASVIGTHQVKEGLMLAHRTFFVTAVDGDDATHQAKCEFAANTAELNCDIVSVLVEPVPAPTSGGRA